MEKEKKFEDVNPWTLFTGVFLLIVSISLLILLPNRGVAITTLLVFIGILGLTSLLAYYSDITKQSVINELKKNK